MKNKTGKKHFFLLIILICIVCNANAFNTDTIYVHSVAMNKDIPAIVVTPSGYSSSQQYPVVYMLHGYSGNYRNSWVGTVPTVEKWADAFGMILVVPDGGYSSWYFDSPVDPSSQYETYISDELVSYIDNHYSTIKSPKGRAITGLSMGGHGALYLAIRNQDVYGAAGSICGGLDLRPFPDNWEISKVLGTYAQNPESWDNHSVINLLHLLTPNSLSLIIDCGTDDFFYPVNRRFHRKLLERNIPHEFTSRPGKHNPEYWNNSIDYHLLYFHKYFSAVRNDK